MSDFSALSPIGTDDERRLAKSVKSSRLGRLGMLGGLAVGLAGEAMASASKLGRTPDGLVVEVHRRTARQLREVFGEMKGLPMKLGQMMSYIEDSIPPEVRHIYRETLGDLRDRATTMPFETMKKVIEDELGGPLESFFAHFATEPFAAASIGQVYRAVMLDGRVVAVKVQYPGIRRAIESDLKNAHMIVSSLSATFPQIDMATIFESMSIRLIEECDYLTEAKNQEVIGQAWSQDPDIRVPTVVAELTRPQILVTELVEGRGWEAMLAGTSQVERNRNGQIIFKFFYRSLYELGALHADPHPGNYVFLPDGTVAFLDFGCVQRYPEEVMTSLRGLYETVVSGVGGDALRQQIVEAYGLPEELDEELWKGVEEYVDIGFEPMTSQQPFRFSRRYTERLMKSVMNLKLAMSKKALWSRRRVYAERPGVVFLHRLAFGVSSILSALEAEADWPAIMGDSLGEVGGGRS